METYYPWSPSMACQHPGECAGVARGDFDGMVTTAKK